MGKTFMIAVDGTQHSDYAFNWYLEEMHREGNTVVLVHCAEMYFLKGMIDFADAFCIDGLSDQIKTKQQEIKTFTNDYVAQLDSRKIPNKCMVLSGDKPGYLICKAASEEEAHGIVMGTRQFRRNYLGSVSEYVTNHAQCTVTVARDPAAVRELSNARLSVSDLRLSSLNVPSNLQILEDLQEGGSSAAVSSRMHDDKETHSASSTANGNN